MSEHELNQMQDNEDACYKELTIEQRDLWMRETTNFGAYVGVPIEHWRDICNFLTAHTELEDECLCVSEGKHLLIVRDCPIHIMPEDCNTEPEDECNWTQEDWDSDMWSGSCGACWSLNDGTPEENDMKYCTNCGKRLVQHIWQQEDK